MAAPAEESETASVYQEHEEKLRNFLLGFQEDDVDGQPVKKYIALLQEIADRHSKILEVELDDIHEEMGEEMADTIRGNALRYKEIIARAADKIMPEPSEDAGEKDITDKLIAARADAEQRARERRQGEALGAEPGNQIPDSLKRRYDVHLLPRSQEKAVKLREVKASLIGSLVTVKGIVTRVTDVKPHMRVATYTCDKGGFEVYQEVTGRSFMPLVQCPVASCCNGTGRLQLQTRASKFAKFQEVKIQEEADQVPQGHVPRSMTVHLNGELTRSCSAGDMITLSGIFLPIPYTGFRALKAGLITDTYMEATNVEKHKKSYHDFVPDWEMEQEIQALEGEDMYHRMAASIAPEIFGHEDVKKALLLLMVGGATREMPDGLRIRGDINVCLMGDPGVAKSQLLKHIATVSPRAVYTTGKGSSGVGLTAAVLRDQNTNELVLEGGALVLADMGICCIDEFDKMEDADRTAIHEVMEQQTVSIAKAGITTTLNARTSVLAAANPAFSKYDPKRSPEENINLPAALFSRFDLLWLILDKPNLENDKRLAKHVTYVHRMSAHPPLQADFEPLSPQVMRAYVSHVRQFQPSVGEDVASYVVDEYVAMRKEAETQGSAFGFTSARTLLAILRLSQALARLRCDNEVTREDIVEARRLMSLSRSSVLQAADAQAADAQRQGYADPISVVYQIIRDHAQTTGQVSVSVADVLEKVIKKGRTKEDLEKCMTEYEELNVWQLLQARSIIRFVDNVADDE